MLLAAVAACGGETVPSGGGGSGAGGSSTATGAGWAATGVASGGAGGSTGGGGGAGGTVAVLDGVVDEGRDCIEVRTPFATFFYDEVGAGFTSIVDRSGHDWVSFSDATGADGEYRGIPNLGSCCHPGYPIPASDTALSTTIEVEQADRVVLRSVGDDGSTGLPWDVSWTFLPTHATLTIHQAGADYYVLYEGTPGGELGDEDFLVTSAGAATRVSLPSAYFLEDLAAPEWVYFEDSALGRALLLAHHEDDAIDDLYRTMGTMTVFGFGRTCDGACQGMSATPQHFSLSFVEEATFEAAAALAQGILSGS
jgi:hypothetical protein